MGFSDNLDDDRLLTCVVCRAPFGIIASFCGECGVRRDQALGIERAKITQTLIPNLPLPPKHPVVENPPQIYPHDVVNPEILTSFPEPPRRPVSAGSLKWQMFKGNIRLRIESIASFSENHAGKLNFMGTFVFLIGTYFFIQAQIFAASTPVSDVENILQKAIVHDTGYFDALGADGSHLRFPAKYQYWNTTSASQWRTNFSGNGWFGSTTISAYAKGKYFDDQPFDMELKAEYTTKFGIFREITWVPLSPPATFTLDYPYNADTVIYINGLAAGTVSNPAVREGTYWVYPGPLKVDYFRNGQKTSDSFEIFIGTSGTN